MAGTVFLIGLVILGLLVIVAGLSTLFLIPIALLVLAALFAVPLLATLRGSRSGTIDTEPTGVPTTKDSSYDPVQEP